MMEDIKKGKINCIIVKDFSRFGRNYLEVCDYLVSIFPFLGVRFISVNDYYDNKKIALDMEQENRRIEIYFRNILSEYYSRDLSQKIQSVKTAKARKGEYLSSCAFFGYQKSKEKNQLVVDKEAAVIVHRIFNMAIQGFSTNDIAKILNSERILSPRNCLWTKNTIRRILKEERYMGKTVYGRYKRAEIGSKKMLPTSKENWIIAENTQEAIISKKEFEKANKTLNCYANRQKRERKFTFLSGKIKCGVCGYALERRERKTIRYYCVTHYQTFYNLCMKGSILESTIRKVLFSCVFQYIFFVLKEKEEEEKKKKQIEDKIKELKYNLKKINRLKNCLYEKYRDTKKTKENFIEEQKWYEQKENFISQEIEKQKEYLKIGLFPNQKTKEEIAEKFTKKIFVYKKNIMKISWTFFDIFGP